MRKVKNISVKYNIRFIYCKKTGDQTIAGVKTFSDNVALNGGLTITGGTTAINSTVLTVQDINVELGINVTNDNAVDGGGIILKGTTDNDKKITWDNANTAWRSNKNFTFAENVGIGTNNPTSLFQIGDGTSNEPSSIAQICGKSSAVNNELVALSLVNDKATGNETQEGIATSLAFHIASTFSPTGKISTIKSGTGAQIFNDISYISQFINRTYAY